MSHNIINYTIFLCFISTLSCNGFVDTFPTEITLGSNYISINDRTVDYSLDVKLRQSGQGTDVQTLLIVEFFRDINNGEFINSLFCVLSDPSEGDYVVRGETSEVPRSVKVSFEQLYDFDMEGWEYEYCSDPNEFFTIVNIDTVSQSIYARGQFKFKRISKHSVPNSGELDRTIYVSFVFYNHYRVV